MKFENEIHDDKQRKTMRGIYISQWVFAALTIVAAIITIAVAAIIGVALNGDASGTESIGAAATVLIMIIPMILQAIVTFVFLAVTVTLAIVFGVKLKKIRAENSARSESTGTDSEESIITRLNSES